MSSIASSSISKNDYLKKYLSSDKPKKKKEKSKSKGMKVVEDDAFISVSSQAVNDSDSDEDQQIKEIKFKLKNTAAGKFKDDTFEVVEEIIRNPGGTKSSVGWNEIKLEPTDKDESLPRRRRHDSVSSDLSPPRRRNESPPIRRRHDSSSSDRSPPRRKKADELPSRRARHDSDLSDRSPPMKKRIDASPPRRQRHDSRSPDRSPPRTKKADESPPRRKRHESMSPTRKGRSRSRSPTRIKRRHEIKQEILDSDASPPRRRRHDSSSPDRSPPRKKKMDESPPRRRRHDSGLSDRSPPRKKGHSRSRSPKSKTLDGKKAGLVSAKEMREETKRLKEKEVRSMEDLGDEIIGRGAETKIRSSAYKKKDTKEDIERKKRETAKNEEFKEKYETWNKGLQQLEERKEQLKEMERTIKEDFARYADDKAMNEHLKDQLYMEDDPMAQFIAKKRQKVKARTSLVYPTYTGSWTPNRFNIPPGYRWDGVDRSNGFESKMALAENKRKAQEEHTYRSILECAD